MTNRLVVVADGIRRFAMQFSYRMLTTKEAIQGAWSQRATPEDNWIDVERSRLLRLFYTIKCIICLRLGRSTEFEYSDDVIDIALFNYQRSYGEYSGADWDVLRVGRGLFKSWYYDFISDGYP